KFLENVDKINFLKIMQRDAEARRVRRIEREKKATLKDKGNEAYAQEDYETAVKCYTDGLAQLRDMQPLYTNRAQAFIKLGRYQEAISDCEWALKCNERCIKAYLHMGKAYLALKKYNESRNCFERIVETEPRREKMIKVDLEEERESQELRAIQEFDRGDVKARTVPLLLEKLSVPGQMPFYYSGGFVILSQAVTDTSQSLFRLNNGFSIISNNDMVRSCLMQKTKDSVSQELCVSVLKLWRIENQKMLMTCPVSRQSIVDLVTSECAAVQKECLAVLFLFSQTPHGRRLATDNLKHCIACEYKEVLYTLLGLIINLSAITSLAIQQDSAVLLCDCCIDLLMDNNGGIITRATGVLSTLLPQSPEAIQHVIQQDVVRTMHRLLKRAGQTTTKFAVKVLTVCTAASRLARDELLKSDKLSVLRHLLGSGCDEMVSGNAALCFAHCLETEGLASNLLGTDVVQLLLRHAAADAKRTAVQKNAAIALGKLC
uniref:Uncharacterized protein n=1 Tax=Mola mola TaxID=94237 RepID=A0A3Q3WLM9_MOLML